MKQISIFDRINRRRIFTFSALILVAVLLSSLLISKNPGSTKAWNFKSDDLTIGQGDILYIGAGDIQSERVWSDLGLYSNTWGQRALSPLDDGYTMPPIATPRASREYGPGDLQVMNYGAGVPNGDGNARCPYVDSDAKMQNGTPITGYCKAIITDGQGAIVRINGDIKISGRLYLGDRVVLIANNITIYSTGKIIGSGQSGASASGHDNSAFGGIGAHNGGQTSAYAPGSPSNFNIQYGLDYYSPNNMAYYNPLTLSDEINSYFNYQGALVSGGNGSRGGNSDLHLFGGDATTNGVGIGGSGGSGDALGGTGFGKDSGAGGGGGGGYGIVLQAQTVLTQAGSIITVKGGDFGIPATSGGYGGPGGGGVIVFRTIDSYINGSIDYSGGLGHAGGFNAVSDGGQGVLVHALLSNPSIKKRLFPMVRSGVANPAFNPYALQLDDVIRVEIRATQLTPPFTLTDALLVLGGDYLSPTGNVYCRPYTQDGRTPTPDGQTVDGLGILSLAAGNVSWAINNPPGNPQNEYILNYYCRVIRK